MPDAVFSLTEQGAAGALHGGLAMRAEASAIASLHRGLDLSLSAGFDAGASGADGPAGASLGVSASAGLDIAAAVPLDLFRGAGVVASASAGIEGAGFLRADVGLTMAQLREEVLGSLDGAWGRIGGLFFDHLTASAGVWARVAAAAEVRGELRIAGNLVALPDGTPPGFTVRGDFGYGVGFAAGASWTANLSIDAPDVLLNEIADEVARAAQEALADSTVARYFDLLLPLAVRGTFRLGTQLATAATDPGSAAEQLAAGLAHEAQQWSLARLTEALGSALGDRVRGALDLVASPGQDLHAELPALQRAQQALHAAGTDPALQAGLDVIAAVWDVAGCGLFDADPVDELREDLAALWALLGLADIVAGWEADATGNFGTQSVPAPSEPQVAALVASRIGKPAGAAITAADLVAFLTDWAGVGALLSALPGEVQEVVGWLTGLAGRPPEDLLGLVLQAWDSSSGQQGLLTEAEVALGNLVDQRLVPALQANGALGSFAGQALIPVLRAFAHVILPGVGQLDGSEDTAGPFREQLSAALFQLLAAPLLTAVDIVSAHALQDGADWAQANARALRKDPTANAVADVEAGLVVLNPAFLFVPTPDDLADVLDLIGSIMRDFDSGIRKPSAALVAELLALELGTDPQQLELQALVDQPDAPPSPGTLATLAEDLALGAGKLVLEVETAELRIIAMHFVRVAERLIKELVKGVEWIVSKLEQFVTWLGQELSALEQKLAELLDDIAAFAADVEQWMAQFAAQVWTWVSDVAAALGQAAEDVWDTITSGIEDAAGTIAGAAEDIGSAVVGGVEDLAGDIGSLF